MCKSEIISIVSTSLLIISELLPETKKIKGDSIFRVIWGFIWQIMAKK